MNNPLGNTDNTQARVLLHSQRRMFGNFHFRLGLYEFEDIISLVDSIDLLAPERKSWYKYGTRIANRLASSHNTSINSDRYLIERGRLTLIETVEDVRSKIRPVRRVKNKKENSGGGVVLKQIVGAIEEMIE